MITLNAIVIDDEQHAIDSFQAISARCCPEIVLKETFTDPKVFLDNAEQHQDCDLIFLDVEMSPFSGFKLLEELHHRFPALPFDVIFLTAYDNYAVDAFEYNALDYLLKPLMEDDLKRAVQRWKEKVHRQFHPLQWELLAGFLKSGTQLPDRMAIPSMEGYTIIHFSDIVRCKADRNYTYIYDKDGDTHMVCRPLKELENMLVPQGFIRVHHSHIVNPDYVVKILRESGGTLELSDGAKIIVTKNREYTMNRLFKMIKKL